MCGCEMTTNVTHALVIKDEQMSPFYYELISYAWFAFLSNIMRKEIRDMVLKSVDVLWFVILYGCLYNIGF